MKLQRALKILPHDALLSVTHTPRAHGGAWVVWADIDGEKHIVTQFQGPYSAASYVNKWYAAVARIAAAAPTELEQLRKGDPHA
jgi:hypothetical protein